MRRRTLTISGTEALSYLSALASENRLAILELLGDKILNIQQISDALEITQPTVTGHVQRLEEAGLITTNFKRGQRGTQKACSSLYDEIRVLIASDSGDRDDSVIELNVPLGAFTAHEVEPTCGLAHVDSIIGLLDDPETFHYPERMSASILWFAQGTISYTFPRAIPPRTRVTRLDFSTEICSEVGGWDNHWASDITVWINDVEIGTWTSPGDFGGEPGRLNPKWWPDRYTQFGLLKNWTVDERGSFVDGVKLSDISVRDLELEASPTEVRLGNRPDARNRGGVTLLGHAFGNYAQDIVLRLGYEHLAPLPQVEKRGGESRTHAAAH